MSRLPWEYEGVGPFNQRMHYDPIADAVTIQYSQPVDKIIRNNQHRRRTEDNSRRRASGDLYQIAEIPMGFIHLWKSKHGVDINDKDHWPAIKQLIQSREYNSSVAVADGHFLTGPVKTHFLSASGAHHPLGASKVKEPRAPLIKSGVF